MKKIRKDESEPLLVPKGYEFVGEPYRHQVVTFMHGLHHKDLAILSTMGTGKTYCAISLARYWIQQGEAKRILVVCPSSVLFNWKDEVEKFSEYDAHVLHSGKSISREGRIKLFSIPSTFYIINYEATLHYLKYILRLESDIVIFDESSRVANPKAKQTQACAKIASQTKYRYILNGTPIPNRPEGLWSQFYILDFGETLGPTYKIFKQCYFTTIKARSKRGKFFSIVKPKSTWHLAEVAKLVAKKSIRYTKEECAPFLPKKNYQVRELTLPRESRKLYKEVFENAKLEIEQLGQNVSAHIILTKFIKASQVASGYLKTDEGNFIRLKSNPKLKELKNLIEEILYEDAITIWCKYRFSIAIIEEMLQEMGVRYEVITGDVQNKSAVAKKFQTTSIKELPVMLCQIRAGGIGLNLHKASFSIFYENEWRLQDRLQAEDRLHRIGQEKPVTIIDLLVKDSIDELVLKAVRNNKEIADFILERL